MGLMHLPGGAAPAPRAVLRFGLTIGLAALACLLAAAPADSAPRFDGEGIDLERKRAYDVGVTDFDSDGRLDVYSTNHMFRDSLLRATNDGFRDVYDSAGFAPNPQVPGVEDVDVAPELDQPGIYIYLLARKQRRPNLRIETHRLREIPGLERGTAAGRVKLVFPKVKVRRSSNAEVEVETKNRIRTVVRFDAKANARISLRANHIALPFSTKVDAPLPLERIFVGSQAVPAPDREFGITLGDRHGAAWADYDRDGELDVFVTNGGLSGNDNARSLPRFGGAELLLRREGRLVGAEAGSGLRRAPCRGREAYSFDFDGDGNLDLFAGCRTQRPRLYRGAGDGSFKEVRRATQRIGNRGTANRLVDLDNDGELELVHAAKFSVRTFEFKRSGRAKLKQDLDAPNDDKTVEALAPGDFDNDGDIDLFAAAPSDNYMLVNRGGRLSVRDPAGFGLPRRNAVAASFVDYDNDSRLDLYLSPDGLYRNTGGAFRKAGSLRSGGSPRFGRASWFDADGDGQTDLLRLTQRGSGLFPQVRLFRNGSAPGAHWLELDLAGRRGNRQAVGARVRLRAGGRTLTQWVGQSEGSRYGQGHYRLYFGLGKQAAAKRVTVFWPDGGRTNVGTVKADQLKTIGRGD